LRQTDRQHKDEKDLVTKWGGYYAPHANLHIIEKPRRDGSMVWKGKSSFTSDS